MNRLELFRETKTKDSTGGVLTDLDTQEHLAMTLELPWRNNQPEVSCIPEGSYYCKITQSPKFGEVYEVTGVPGRSHILFHWGNYPKDTNGCILLGRTSSLNAVWHSKETFTQFMKRMAKRPFLLIVE